MTQANFRVHLLGFDAKQTSNLMVGGEPMFSRLMQDMVPEIASIEAGVESRISAGHSNLRTRVIHYQLDPMVWEPLRLLLQSAMPGAIKYSDTVIYRTDLPGWDFRTEWEGVPGINPSCVQVLGGARVFDDGPLGCFINYEVVIKCTLPLVGKMVERAVCDGFRKTCQQMPQVVQKYFVMWDQAQHRC
jgi:hypothetical protein